MKSARDLMTENIVTIPVGSDFKEVVDLFLSNRIKTAPVVTENKEVCGILDEIGLVNALLQYQTGESTERVTACTKALAEAKFVKEDDDLPSVVNSLIEAETHRVLVQNEQGQLVGIIGPQDILQFLKGEKTKTAAIRAHLRGANDDMKQLQTEISELVETAQQYQDMYEESPMMMHSVNRFGKVIMANRKLREALDYSRDEIIGKTIYDLYPEPAHEAAKKGLERIREEGFHAETLTTMLKKDGEALAVDVASQALYDSKGQFNCTITVSRVVDAKDLIKALEENFPKIESNTK